MVSKSAKLKNWFNRFLDNTPPENPVKVESAPKQVVSPAPVIYEPHISEQRHFDESEVYFYGAPPTNRVLKVPNVDDTIQTAQGCKVVTHVDLQTFELTLVLAPKRLKVSEVESFSVTPIAKKYHRAKPSPSPSKSGKAFSQQRRNEIASICKPAADGMFVSFPD